MYASVFSTGLQYVWKQLYCQTELSPETPPKLQNRIAQLDVAASMFKVSGGTAAILSVFNKSVSMALACYLTQEARQLVRNIQQMQIDPKKIAQAQNDAQFIAILTERTPAFGLFLNALSSKVSITTLRTVFTPPVA